MKSKIQTSKNNNNMEVHSNSKNILIDTISDILVDSLDSSGLETVRQALFENIGKINSVIKKNNSKESAPTKKVKDPNAPKRGKSSYIFFCVDKRQEIIDANPEMPAKEIIQQLGNMWRSLSTKDKQKYVDQSNKDRQRYENEMSTYVPPENLGVSVKKTKDGPKRGRTAYIFFCTEQRPVLKEEDPDLNTKEITSRLGAKWKSLSEDDKSPYIKLAEEDKKRYEKDKLNWANNSETSTSNNSDVVDVPVKSKKSKKEKSEKKAKKEKTKKSKKVKKSSKKKSGFIIFCQEERDNVKETNPDYSSQQVTQELGELWAALTQEEQDEYNDKV
jgi:hypothetical protein